MQKTFPESVTQNRFLPAVPQLSEKVSRFFLFIHDFTGLFYLASKSHLEQKAQLLEVLIKDVTEHTLNVMERGNKICTPWLHLNISSLEIPGSPEI